MIIQGDINRMDRYKAGLFQHHSLFNTVDYAWRVEPGSEYTCNMFQGDDPFQIMKANNKKIGKLQHHVDFNRA